MQRLQAIGWSYAQARMHCELAAKMGLDPLRLCPVEHVRALDD